MHSRRMRQPAQRRILATLGATVAALATFAVANATAAGPYDFCQGNYTAYQTCQDGDAHAVTQGYVYPAEAGCFRVTDSAYSDYYCTPNPGGYVVSYPYPYAYGYPTCHEHAGADPDYITCAFTTT